jgi:hypothetical protein
LETEFRKRIEPFVRYTIQDLVKQPVINKT